MSRLRCVIPVLALGIVVLSSARAARSDDPPAPRKKGNGTNKQAKDPAAFSDKELKKIWAGLIAHREKIMHALDTLQKEFQSVKGLEEERKFQARFEQLSAEFQAEVAPELNRLADEVNKRDPSDPVAAQILIGRLLPQRPRMLAPGQPRPQVPDANYAQIAALARGLKNDDQDTRAIVENILGILVEDKRFTEVTSIADKLVEAKDTHPRVLVLDALAHLYLSDFDRAWELAKRAAEKGGLSPETADFVKSCGEYVEFWKKEQQLRASEEQADDLPRVLLKTSKGEIELELFENEAPNTVANFISLVEARKYDGLPFHRYEPNFIIQGGAVNARGEDRRNPDRGGPGYAIACECYNGKARMHFQGSLSMAHAGKDTGGSQFFITHTPTPHLNWGANKSAHNHTVFGRVLKGLDVALSLRAGDKIESATVLRKRDHAYAPEKLGDAAASGIKLSNKPKAVNE